MQQHGYSWRVNQQESAAAYRFCEANGPVLTWVGQLVAMPAFMRLRLGIGLVFCPANLQDPETVSGVVRAFDLAVKWFAKE